MSWKRILDKTYKHKYFFCSQENFLYLCLYVAQNKGIPADDQQEMYHPQMNGQWLFFEPGGYGGRANAIPQLEFQLGGKTLALDVDKVSPLLIDFKLHSLREIEVGHKKFYLIDNRFSVLALDESERTHLMEQLQESQQRADQQAEQFSQGMEEALLSLHDKGYIYVANQIKQGSN